MTMARLFKPIRFPAPWVLTFAAVGLSVNGCATYQAEPLTLDAVDQALSTASGSQQDPPIPSHAQSGSRDVSAQRVQLDPRRPLSPDNAALVAVMINPSLRVERDRRGLSQAQLLQAGILPNPTLSYSMDFPVGVNTAGEANAYGIGVDWDITSLITHGARVKAAKAQAGQIDLDVAWQEWQVAESAKAAAYGVAALEAQAAQWRRVDEQLGQNLALVRRAVDQHNRTLVDLAAAEASSRDAHASYLAAKAALHQQRLALNRALGVPADTTVRVRRGVAAADRLVLPPRADLLAAIDHRLDLRALRRGYQSQEQTVRAAVLSQFPRVSLGPTTTRDTGAFQTLGFGISMDLPIFDRNQGHIAIERATRQRLFDEYVNRVFQSRADVARALDAIDAATEQIAAGEAAVKSLVRLVQTYKRALNQGNADVLLYYQTRNNLAQKRIAVLELEQKLLDQRIALELATGMDLGSGSTESGKTRGEANLKSMNNRGTPKASPRTKDQHP